MTMIIIIRPVSPNPPPHHHHHHLHLFASAILFARNHSVRCLLNKLDVIYYKSDDESQRSEHINYSNSMNNIALRYRVVIIIVSAFRIGNQSYIKKKKNTDIFNDNFIIPGDIFPNRLTHVFPWTYVNCIESTKK